MSFCSLDWDILISSFQKITYSWSNYPSLKTFGGTKLCKYPKYIENWWYFFIHDCFANIFATKASIFMKFQIYIYRKVKKYQKIFRKDPSTNMPTRGVTMRARVSSLQNSRVHVYSSLRARVCTDLYERSFE